MKVHINWNGSITAPGDFRISPDNRGLRYGDGLFETMKARKGKIDLEPLHFERLFSSLRLLQFEIPSHFTAEYLREQVRLLLEKNSHTELARARLMVYRGDGGVYDSLDHRPQLLIQSWPLLEPASNPHGKLLQIDVFHDARKACDVFSSLKSNNYLCYLMGALFAKNRGLDDALILNAYGRIADATIANVFIVTDGMIKTPPLTEGCVNGVYRRYLLQCFQKDGLAFREEPLKVEELMEAEEVFLTNAITGIRWVHRCGGTIYGNETSVHLHTRYAIPGDGFQT